MYMKHLYSFNLNCLPPSVNHIWRSTWKSGRPIFYKESKVVKFEKEASPQLDKIKNPLTDNLEAELIFIFKSEKRYAQRDLDNLLKLVFDLLKTNEVIKDDNQIVKITCQKQTGEIDQVIGKLFLSCGKPLKNNSEKENSEK